MQYFVKCRMGDTRNTYRIWNRKPPGPTTRSWEHNANMDLHKMSSEDWRCCHLISWLNYVLYRVLILCDNHRFSFPVAPPPRVWEVYWVGYVDMIKDPTGSGNELLSDTQTYSPYCIVTVYVNLQLKSRNAIGSHTCPAYCIAVWGRRRERETQTEGFKQLMTLCAGCRLQGKKF